MGSCEATNMVLTKIKSMDPENASKVMGYLLINLEETDLVRLAFSPDHYLRALILRVKTQLGLSSNIPSAPSTPSSPSPLNPIARPTSSNPFSHSSPRIANNGFDFSRNPSSPSSHGWALPGFPSNPISPKSSPLLSYENIRAGSLSAHVFSPRMNGDCNTSGEFVDENQMNEYFSFLNESSKNDDLVDPGLELGHALHNWQSFNNGDAHFHRRSYSASDACFGSEEAGVKPCLYFARGFCKNGSNCKFVHGGLTDSLDVSSCAIVGSPSKFEGFEQREEMMRLKAVQQQKLVAASQLVAGASPSSYEKYINFLMQQQNDPQRAAAAAGFMMGEEFYKFGRGRQERNDFLAMVSSEKPNSASRQIYLTFPAESTFKDEDVSEYFSKFGPVQDVRIPYQQKRMFGFVTFVHPETVRLILSKGNPHFICDSRVLVKPYKEKGKVPDKRQQHQQQLERGDFPPCLSPSGFDSKDLYDLHLGARMFYNQQEVLRRKLEEAEFQQAIELQGRRLMNLQLPDFKNNHLHHQRSLSVGAPLTLARQLHCQSSNEVLSSDGIKGDAAGFCGSLVSTISLPTKQEHQQQQEDNPARIHDNGCEKTKDSTYTKVLDLPNSVERVLPDTLFASPTKASGSNLSDFSPLAEVMESAAFSAGSSSNSNLEPPITSRGIASD